jgi:hypothetical protein
MTTATQPGVSPETNSSASSSILPPALPEDSEAGIDAMTETNQRIFSSLLEAFFQDRDEEDEEDEGEDDVVPAGSRGIAAGCEKLTSEIIQLEKLRHAVARLLAQPAGVPETLTVLLQLLLEGYDCKIRDCEEQLDRLLEPNRRRFARCGILADYFIG